MPDSSVPMDLKSPKAACAFRIVEKLNNAGFQALFAGGCVRDHLLGAIPTDYDIATSATPDEVEELFSKTIPVGKQFGVMLVLLDTFQFEVATFRTEGGYQDGRRPGFVKFAGAQEDVAGRDFTVNGLLYDPILQKILDYVGGQKDLNAKIIRCIGNPSERFEEDKLRLLRAVRFAARLDFQIESDTWTEIKKRATQINVVSKERIRDELEKIVNSPHIYLGLKLMTESGLWQAIFSNVDPAVILRLE
ncbi:MAG TPA: phosphohydrolase, partial [Candidatus Omnitrophica bacterium]|nr:phosphohydrolase [Candidatus Omnitrophota bacterium]